MLRAFRSVVTNKMRKPRYCTENKNKIKFVFFLSFLSLSSVISSYDKPRYRTKSDLPVWVLCLSCTVKKNKINRDSEVPYKSLGPSL
jgi:hypothetical protein